jgi:hypothetical protein
MICGFLLLWRLSKPLILLSCSPAGIKHSAEVQSTMACERSCLA